MNQDHKQRLIDRQMQGIPKESPVYRELEKACIEELDSIEPILDDILQTELKDCVAIIVESMTPEQRELVSRRLNERAAQIVRH
jgi:hypothetical protein